MNKELFETIQDGTRVSITMSTFPKLKGGKANPHQGRVTKLTTGAIGILYTSGKGYFEKVNDGLIKEEKAPDFEPKPRAWGVRVERTPLIKHKEKLYLDVIFESPGETEFFFLDTPISRDEIEGLEDKKEGDQGGLDEKVYVRTIALESIMDIQFL